MEKQIGKLFSKWGHLFIFVFSIAMISMSMQFEKKNKIIVKQVAEKVSSIQPLLPGEDEVEPEIFQYGKASYYAGFFIGRKTANGEIFTKHLYTCAHKKLPFGTKLKVTNLQTGEAIIVRVNDRGPYIKHRVIDLSLQGAKALSMLQPGVIDVSLEIVDSELSDVGKVDNMNKIYLGNSKYAYVKKDRNVTQDDVDAYIATNFEMEGNNKIDKATGLKIVNEEEPLVEKENTVSSNQSSDISYQNEEDIIVTPNEELKSLDELPSDIIIKNEELTPATTID